MTRRITSELLELILHRSLADCTWATHDPALTTIVIQVNGKLRGTLGTQRGKYQTLNHLHKTKLVNGGKEIKNIIYVPDTLINFIVS